jgi:repressor LexA
MHELTDRQQAIYDFVRERIARDGLPPTWAEIARAFGFRQTRAAQKHLQALEAKGYLTLLPGKARGIRLAGPDARVPGRVEATPRSSAPARPPQLELPILGRVAAGAPIGADAQVEKHLVVDRAMFSPSPHYLLRVHGDSMRDDGILDGDLVAVHRTGDARDGQVVVARVDGEVTIKRLRLHRDGVRLLPRNPAFAPIDIAPGQDFAIEGVYCGLIREA